MLCQCQAMRARVLGTPEWWDWTAASGCGDEGSQGWKLMACFLVASGGPVTLPSLKHLKCCAENLLFPPWGYSVLPFLADPETCSVIKCFLFGTSIAVLYLLFNYWSRSYSLINYLKIKLWNWFLICFTSAFFIFFFVFIYYRLMLFFPSQIKVIFFFFILFHIPGKWIYK